MTQEQKELAKEILTKHLGEDDVKTLFSAQNWTQGNIGENIVNAMGDFLAAASLINQQPKEVENLKQELKELEWRAVAYHTTLKRIAESDPFEALPRTLLAEVEERVKTEPLRVINQQGEMKTTNSREPGWYKIRTSKGWRECFYNSGWNLDDGIFVLEVEDQQPAKTEGEEPGK